MKDRIKQIQDYAKLSQQDFSSFIGISPATLSGVYAGRTQASNKLVNAIHAAFPEINIYWLMFGTGSMFVEDSSPVAAQTESASAPQPSASHSSSAQVENPAKEPSNVPSVEIAGVAATYDGPLFQMPQEPSSSPAYASHRSGNHASRVNMGFQNYGKNIYKQVRKIKEIRVFFDDGTYESFVPSSK